MGGHPPHRQGTGGGFQDQVARRLTGRLPRRKTDRKWEYTLVSTASKEAGFQTIEECIQQIQNTFAQYIYTRYLLDLLEGTERTPVTWVGMRWWYQVYINLTGAREMAVEVYEAE